MYAGIWSHKTNHNLWGYRDILGWSSGNNYPTVNRPLLGWGTEQIREYESATTPSSSQYSYWFCSTGSPQCGNFLPHFLDGRISPLSLSSMPSLTQTMSIAASSRWTGNVITLQVLKGIVAALVEREFVCFVTQSQDPLLKFYEFRWIKYEFLSVYLLIIEVLKMNWIITLKLFCKTQEKNYTCSQHSQVVTHTEL